MQYKFSLDPKIKTLLIDGIVTLVLYFVGKYAAPGILDDVKIVLLVVQPIVAGILLGMYQTEQAVLKAGREYPAFMVKK